ncbi:BnaA01g18120D [Brassica napus]|uniref:BnaA01g18120D protein n=1 Tax=Brassica napus TaxID=3708 RepID=A0A078HYH1_BRANA|nr:BnaA01g18120D [Brassica napus]
MFFSNAHLHYKLGHFLGSPLLQRFFHRRLFSPIWIIYFGNYQKRKILIKFTQTFKEVALVRKKIDFVNKEFSTSQSVKLPPPAKNPQGDLEKVPKKRRLSSQIQVEEKNDEIRLWGPVEALQEE